MDCSDQYKEALNTALLFLAGKDRTGFEVREKLYKSGFDQDTVGRVIINLREYRFVDDFRYADRYLARRCFVSRQAASAELKRRGVCDQVIEKTMQVRDSDTEFRAALALAVKKVKQKGENYSAGYIASFLTRKGFDQFMVDMVCNHLENELLSGDIDSIKLT